MAAAAARDAEPTMVRLFNILDYWAQLAQRSVAPRDGLGYRDEPAARAEAGGEAIVRDRE